MSETEARVRALQQVVVENPGSPHYPELAGLLSALRRYPEAAAVAKAGLGANPLPEGRFALAEAQLHLGAVSDAQGHVEAGLEAKPDHPWGLRVLASCHAQAGRTDLARSVLERGRDRHPGDSRFPAMLARLPPADPDWTAGTVELDSAPTPEREAPREEEPSDELELDLGEAQAPRARDEDSDPFARLDFSDMEPSRPAAPAPAAAPPPEPSGEAPAPRVNPDSGIPSVMRPTTTVAAPAAPAPKLKTIYLAIGAGVVLLVAGLLVVRAVVRSNRFDAAMAAAQRAVTSDVFQGYEDAERHLAIALDIDPHDPEALGLGSYVSARLFTGFDAGTEALVRAEERLAEAEALEVVPPGASAARALLDLQRGQAAQASRRAGLAAREHPDDPRLPWVEALADVRMERGDLAAEALARLGERVPTFLPAASSHAEILERLGRHAEAAAARAKTLERHPAHITSLIGALRSSARGHLDGPETLARIEARHAEIAGAASPTEQCELYLAAAELAVLLERPYAATAAEDRAISVLSGPNCRAALGRHLVRRDRHSEASDLLATAAALLPPDQEARAHQLRIEAARAAARSGRTARGLAILAELPPGPRARVARAQIELADREVDKAKKTLAPALQRRTVLAEAWALSTELHLAIGDERGARADAVKARRAAKTLPALTAAGRALLAVGEPVDAARVLQQAMKRTRVPSYELLTLTGRALASRSRRRTEGFEVLERAIRLSPDSEPAVDAYLDLAPPDRVAAFIEELPPPHGPALTAHLALTAGDLDAAAGAVERARAGGGGGSRVAILAARLALARGEANALDRLRQLADTFAGRPEAHLALGDAQLRMGRLGEAASAYEEALRMDPSLVRARVGLSQSLAVGGTDPIEAVQVSSRTVEWLGRRPAPRHEVARAHSAAAVACARRADAECANREMARAERLIPDTALVQLARGRVQEELGDAVGAAQWYRKAALLPGGEEGLLRAGLLAADERIPAEGAADDLEKFLALLPGHAQADNARQALRRIQ